MLPYTAEVYFAVLGRYLAAHPWSTAMVVFCALSAAVASLSGHPLRDRVMLVAAAVGWLWIGGVFHLHYLAGIHFAAPVYAGLFLAQGAMLLWVAARRGAASATADPGYTGILGLGVLCYAALLVPLFDSLWGLDPQAPRLIGAAPTPTALYTLGLLARLRRPVPPVLLAVPMLWCTIAGFGGWVLEVPTDLAAPIIALVVVIVVLVENRRISRTRRDAQPGTPS